MAKNAVSEMESRTDMPSRRESNGAGTNIQRLVMIGAAIGLAAFAMKQLPDLRRYLKMRSM